ncbi:hypothetical protein K1T71_008172 [Dendrolimus kikuchii]|uniref:Uncharacterized protein n=1 Tax=Dendrolimus kikuchii TaxID=765133 RepID=A0ACC1CWH1_9NEOP|nr:hypothetical protein K1T71_008172 [Dendrolimus kikuchii]
MGVDGILDSVDDKAVVVPWIGSTSSKNLFTLVVISSCPKIIENISEALSDVHSKGSYKWKMNVLRSFNLEALLKQAPHTGKIAIDFIVMALDTSNILCLEITKDIVKQVHPDLRSRRVVLVNAGRLPPNSMAISAGELISFSADVGLNLLNANVFIREEAEFLAQRLFRYMEVTIGVKTGIPNINI